MAEMSLTDLPDILGQMDNLDQMEVYLQAELRRIREDPLTYKHPCHAMQERWLMSKARRRIVVAANRVGKFLANDEPVLTVDGWKPIGEVEVGDILFSETGERTRVRAVYPQGVQPMWKVTFDDGVSVIAGGPHLWKAKDPEARFRKPNPHRTPTKQGKGERYGKWDVYSTEEILGRTGKHPKPPARFSIPVTYPVRLPERKLPLHPYLLGVLLGDGNLRGDIVRFSTADNEILESVSRLLPDGCMVIKDKTRKYDYRIKGTKNGNNPLIRALKQIGVWDLLAHEKHVPKEYLFSSPKQRLLLLQGLMDTDGTVGKRGHCSFSSSSKKLAEDVLFLNHSMGWKAIIHTKETTHRLSYRVSLFQADPSVFRLSRKKNLVPTERPRTNDRIIKSIVPDGSSEATCIEVDDPNHTFLTRGCVVTHNTEGAMRDVLWTARGNHPYRKTRAAANIWVGCPDFPSYLRFTRPTFDAWCPPDWIVGDFHETEKYVDIRRVDGGICRIFFLSFDMPRTKWQGAGVDAIWLDEESPEDIFKECLARIVTTRGWILLTFTPVSGQGWWFDRIWTPAIEGLSNWQAFTMPLATKNPANEEEFEVGKVLVPHLTRDQVIEFASEYPDPDERSIRVFGEPRGRQGLVYKQYRKLIHNIPRFEIGPQFDLWGGLDPGYHGFAAVIGAIDPTNRVSIVAEYFSQQETTHDRFKALAQTIRDLRPEEEWRKLATPTVIFFVDTEDPQVVLELNMEAAIAAEEDQREGLPMIRLAFASLDQGLKARKAGFLRVQQLLQPSPVRKTPHWVERAATHVGEPLIYFVDDLHSEWQTEEGRMKESRVLWELTHYSWKKPPKNTTVQKDDGDENSAHGAHAMAALRYLIMARLGPPEGDDNKDDPRADLPPHIRDIWEHMDALENRQLEETGQL